MKNQVNGVAIDKIVSEHQCNIPEIKEIEKEGSIEQCTAYRMVYRSMES